MSAHVEMEAAIRLGAGQSTYDRRFLKHRGADALNYQLVGSSQASRTTPDDDDVSMIEVKETIQHAVITFRGRFAFEDLAKADQATIKGRCFGLWPSLAAKGGAMI